MKMKDADGPPHLSEADQRGIEAIRRQLDVELGRGSGADDAASEGTARRPRAWRPMKWLALLGGAAAFVVAGVLAGTYLVRPLDWEYPVVGAGDARTDALPQATDTSPGSPATAESSPPPTVESSPPPTTGGSSPATAQSSPEVAAPVRKAHRGTVAQAPQRTAASRPARHAPRHQEVAAAPSPPALLPPMPARIQAP